MRAVNLQLGVGCNRLGEGSSADSTAKKIGNQATSDAFTRFEFIFCVISHESNHYADDCFSSAVLGRETAARAILSTHASCDSILDRTD